MSKANLARSMSLGESSDYKSLISNCIGVETFLFVPSLMGGGGITQGCSNCEDLRDEF